MRQFTCRINNALHVVGGSEAAADRVVLMYNSHLEAAVLWRPTTRPAGIT